MRRCRRGSIWSANALASTRSQRCRPRDRKSTRLNSSHLVISYAVFCLKKKKEFDAKITDIVGSLAPILLVVVILLYAGSTHRERLACGSFLLAMATFVFVVSPSTLPV